MKGTLVAIFGGIGITVYHAAMPTAVPGVPPETVVVARDTLGGALALAGQLADQMGAPCSRSLVRRSRAGSN